MTLTQCLEKAAAGIDEHIAEAEIAAEDLLQKHGASAEDIREFMQRHRIEWAEWRAKTLSDVRKWLERDGEALH